MKKWLLILTVLFSSFGISQNLPDNFVYLKDFDVSIQTELRYYTNHNFIGKPINGYNNNCVIVSKPAAKQLQIIQQKLLKDNLSLKIFDAYRPQTAVNHFVKWAKILNDTVMKQQYYPNVAKSQLFNLGYIASKSGHSRGSTVDLTLVDLRTNKELDMGSSYDFFGEVSHPFYKNITSEQKKNRFLLRNIMINNGFIPYNNEWWHFTLKNEPFPKTYHNFMVE